jgi:enoyl-CoA hydratase/carnithine racemase
VPVICAISGYCIGAGIDLSSACDIRICSKDAKFSIKEVDIGICADLGTI